MGTFGSMANAHQRTAHNQGNAASYHMPNPTSNSSMSTTRTPDMMPLLGAKTAPAKFRGKYDTVKRFIRQYKQMCAVYNVPDRDKCHRIIDYCSSRVTRFIEALDSFVNEDWDQLEKDILTYYDAELHESRYLLSDLDKLVEFLTMANWLLHKGKITLDKRHTKFWYGLNSNLCEIVEIIYNMFTCNQFDAELTVKKSKNRRAKLEELLKMSMSGDEDTDTSSSKDSMSTSDSESDSKHRKSRKKKEAKHHKPLTKTKKSKHASHKKASSDETSRKAPESRDTDKVEELVDKLAKMKWLHQPNELWGWKIPFSITILEWRDSQAGILHVIYGTYIRRIGTKTFEDAIRRTTMSSNLVTINMFQADTDSGNEDEAYADHLQMSEETDIDEEYNDDAYAYSEQKGAGTWPSKKDGPLPSEPIPVDVQPSWIQDLPELEDIEMAEETHPLNIGQTPEMKGTETMTERKRGMRQPLIQQWYNAEGLMKTVLNAPVTIPIGEFMAYSAELIKQLIKELQNCTVKFSEKGKTNTVNAISNVAQVNLVTMEPIQTKPLVCLALIIIEVTIRNESKKVLAKAIVDLESEINIVCQELAHELNKSYPITPLKEISCSDTNGNLGLLSGQFSNIRLEQGPIVTNTAFFMGNQNITFQLLLGWPWLRGNLVLISERLEGTYLVYHDPRNAKNYKELFVLEENWKKEATKLVVMHLAKTGIISANRAWKINAGQEIVRPEMEQVNRPNIIYTASRSIQNEYTQAQNAVELEKTGQPMLDTETETSHQGKDSQN
ncbi:hypothetical protein ARMGADRAFT_1035943 [Armillaria gallica]|uniref:Uncharacterized protein n=1 Tax=Armillaria gallica TaxID=47427 RepID=A0A2H3D3I0_ARMGA|nr:hypothetical protein ARMGADRAFT_1035943 [Armillaria gallica]